MSAPLPFDARPLTEPLSRGEAKRILAQRGRKPGCGPVAGAIGLALSILGVLIGLVLMTQGTPTSDAPVVIGGILTAVGAVLIVAVSVLRGHGDVTRIARLAAFAEANGMRYDERPGLTSYVEQAPGMIFDRRFTHPVTSHTLSAPAPRRVEFGIRNYEESQSERQRSWGYIAVQLDAPLPHIVLDATANNRMGRSNLPLVFPDARALSLEGEFGRHFRLLCPPGYEPDAYYLFTPDVMARFVDTAARLDVEIIDDWLFFYFDGRRAMPVDPDQWAWMFSIVAAMLEKIGQWARWRDERLAGGAPEGAPRDLAEAVGFAGVPDGAGGSAAPAPGAGVPPVPPVPAPVPVMRPPKGVAQGGRRLRARTPLGIGGIVVLVALTAFWILGEFGGS
ncbi:hypothetical protein [Microbacterium sp. gxy059]|uniref:hypothetical protein n=1 Tax=Microbacterium sp. gxy059 TaxID=2957199 RepID=UPI003D970378